jgi:hypothetical protein
MVSPTEVAVGVLAKRRPASNSGKANASGEETGTCTLGAAGVVVQTRGEGSAEITSGRACAQQGLTATCKDLLCEAKAEAGGRATGLAHEPVGAMKWE